MCVFTFSSSAFAFLIEMNFSFKSLCVIWSSSPQRSFHYYFTLCIVSWQYQKYWTILTLVLCLLYVTPLVCSSYSSFAPIFAGCFRSLFTNPFPAFWASRWLHHFCPLKEPLLTLCKDERYFTLFARDSHVLQWAFCHC